MHRIAHGGAALAALLLSACGGSVDVGELARAAGAPVRAEWKDARLDVDVPTPVITIGFPAADVARLADTLKPHRVDHEAGDINQMLPPDPDEIQEHGPAGSLPLFGESIVLPVVPTAVYQVRAAPPAMVGEFRAALAAAKLGDTTYDANAIEDWLAAALPRHGFAVRDDAPAIVVLHLGEFGVHGHGWRIQGFAGRLEPVRVFGERYPLLVLDPSAVADPYNAGSTESFSAPVASGSTGPIAAFIRNATEFRVLQGSLYPVAQASCHAVTAVFGVRPTSVSETTPLVRKALDAFDPARIKAAFDHLTGGDVFFDVKVLNLPADDPALDALTRGEFPAMEVLRGYLTVMFDSYHVDHPGCEEYLSVVVQNDMAAVPGGGIIGIGTWDDTPGKRISMSWLHDALRLLIDPQSPACEPADPFLNTTCGGREYLNVWEYLFSHETGHILGQRHPHDISLSGGTVRTSNAFTSVWSSMSYQQDGRMIDFGRIDANNWRRNRAGFALGLAAANGRENTPEWHAAMNAARQLDWQGVWAALNAGKSAPGATPNHEDAPGPLNPLPHTALPVGGTP